MNSRPSDSSASGRLGYAVAMFLGLNAWGQLHLAAAISAPAGTLGLAGWLWCAVPPCLLGLGGRLRSDGVLLFAVPLAIAAGLAFMPAALAPDRYPALRLLMSGLSLVVYILAVTWVASATQPRARATTTTKLPGHARPSRWARRERVYWGLATVTLVVPVALLWQVLYDAPFLSRLAALYGDRAGAMQILLMLGALILWFAMVRWAVIDVLVRHRSGDPAMLSHVEALTKRRALRPGFVLAIAIGVSAVAVISMLRWPP